MNESVTGLEFINYCLWFYGCFMLGYGLGLLIAGKIIYKLPFNYKDDVIPLSMIGVGGFMILLSFLI